jgi:ubiquinol-cytochrome c reductase cytochrome c1 subunit
MPHVLGELQGWKELHVEEHAEGDHHAAPELVTVKEGTMTQAEYEQMTRDLTAYLAYVSEPAQLHRGKYGVFVLLFLGILFVFAYFLKKEYWKDIH